MSFGRRAGRWSCGAGSAGRDGGPAARVAGSSPSVGSKGSPRPSIDDHERQSASDRRAASAALGRGRQSAASSALRAARGQQGQRQRGEGHQPPGRADRRASRAGGRRGPGTATAGRPRLSEAEREHRDPDHAHGRARCAAPRGQPRQAPPAIARQHDRRRPGNSVCSGTDDEVVADARRSPRPRPGSPRARRGTPRAGPE